MKSKDVVRQPEEQLGKMDVLKHSIHLPGADWDMESAVKAALLPDAR